MRKIYTILAALFVMSALIAQVPQKMSYQAIIRDASNNLVANQGIGMKLTIQDVAFVAIYVETHSTTTDENGIATVEVGAGTPITGTLAGVNWGAGVYTIKTETDPTSLGGTNYAAGITGTSDVQSVPYALYVKKVGDTNFNGDYNTLTNKPTFDGTETKVTAGSRFTVTGTGSVANPYVLNASPIVGGYSHYLGEDVGYGIIFYIYTGSDGLERVLIANYDESSQLLQTASSTTNGKRTWDGVYNTTLYTNSPAKTYVESFGPGWYIPSKDELNIMYQNRFHLNKGLYDHNIAFPGTANLISATDIYWSSTEKLDASTAWQFDFVSGECIWEAKENSRKVRAVRAFIIIPTLITTAASSITSYTATSGGNITSDGGASVTSRGVCYNTTGNPYITASKTTDGSGPGAFTSSLTGLAPGTTYYVKAYATNSEGTNYGNEISFTTPPVIPVLTTNAISSIKSTSALSGGNISYDGGASVTVRGVCWSTSPNPTTALATKTSNGGGTGSFASSITGLTLGVTYYVRAYATNSAGTAYGDEVSFTTASTIPTITTSSVIYFDPDQATGGGNVTSDDGSPVTTRGVCWNTTGSPTTANNIKAVGAGTGIFTTNLITPLAIGTTYYVRAYATNGAGTAYGTEIVYTHLTIGSPWQGGKIAYICQPGDACYVDGETHGMIAALNDLANATYSFCTTGFGSTGTSYGTGASNTAIILGACGGINAAWRCDNYVSGIYSDWFLPSQDELNLLFINKAAIGNFAGGNTLYWSSTEDSGAPANGFTQDFTTGATASWAKNTTYHVRPVRYF